VAVTHEKRIAALEKLLDAGEANPMARPMRPEVVAVLDEFSSMRAMMSDKSYRGSPNGPVKIEPRDVAREWYGGDYTKQEFRELAVLRALEGLGFEDSEIDERMPELLAMFEEFDRSREGEGDT
jgi:hypothetical protein